MRSPRASLPANRSIVLRWIFRRDSHELDQRRDRSVGCAALRFERRQCVPSERRPFSAVFDQLHENQRELRHSNDADRISTGKKIDDIAKILVMVAGDDGDAVESRLKNVVTAARHEAAPDEGDGGQRIERGQLSDTIDQKHAASKVRRSTGTPPHPEAESFDELGNLRKSFRMARGEIITAFG